MSRGIYIVGNDRVGENAIALLNSIRYYDPNIEIFLIPFDDNYQPLADNLQAKYNVKLFPDLEFLNKFTGIIAETFDQKFLALPNKMRKLVVWFGPLDEFLYIDTDIIVFDKIAEVLNYLSEFDFFCCDYHHSGRGIQDIFSPLIREQKIFTQEQLQDVFNSGFWGSKKGIISESQMYELLRECSQHQEYFDFSRKVTDQPILNYLVLKSITKRFNLVNAPLNGAGSWAGSKHFQRVGDRLIDPTVNQPLQYLHWAGIRIEPGCPYWDIWEHYRYLNSEKPDRIPSTKPQKNILKQLTSKIKRLF